MPDLFPAEPVMRLWALYCVAAIGGVIAAAHLVSHAADHLARRRSTIRHPATAPNLVPLLPSPRTRNRLAVVGHHEAPPSRAPKLAPERAHVVVLRNQDQSVQPG